MRPSLELLENRLVPTAFVQRVLADTPELQNPNLSDFERVNLIREWAYTQIDGTENSELSLEYSNYSNFSPAQFLDRFDHNLGGVQCGGAAYFLQMTYRALGYESAVVNGGFPEIDGASHVMTLVRIKSGGNMVDSVQDALVNVTYTDSAGGALDFGQIRQYLDWNQSNRIFAQPGVRIGRDFLVDATRKSAYESGFGSKCIWSGSEPPQFTEVRDGVWKFQSDITGELFDQYWLAVKDVPVEKRVIALFSNVLSDIHFAPRTDEVLVQVIGAKVHAASHVFEPFSEFQGTMVTATGDLNGDGVVDVIVNAGIGNGPHIKAYDGHTGELVRNFFAFVDDFLGGVSLATGDLNGDGYADLIVAAGPGGGPHVKAYDGPSGEIVRSFFAYDPDFTGGVYVAAGDLNGDGSDEIITGAGPDGGPHVRAFDYHTGQLVANFFAYAPAFTGGVRVASGDIDRDGFDDIVTGAGSGGGPHVRIFDGPTGAILDEFFVGSSMDGVFVDVDADGMVRTNPPQQTT